MNLSFQSAWLILTVAIPGLTFLTVFWCLSLVLGINIPMMDKMVNSQLMIVGALITTGFGLQFFGIAVEDMLFKFGVYRHRDQELQSAFDKRYEIRASLDFQKDSVVEYTLGQFFMSHNIAVGMFINLIWMLIYSISSHSLGKNVYLILVYSLVTVFSCYVPINRYSQVCKVLYSKGKRIQIFD